MDVLFHVSTPEGARILSGLAAACLRAHRSFACFFTNDGVRAVNDAALPAVLAGATRAVACADSWQRFGAGLPCPVELGSQTTNSTLVGEAGRIVSL